MLNVPFACLSTLQILQPQLVGHVAMAEQLTCLLTRCSFQVGQTSQWQPLTPQQAADMCWGLATARHCTPALGHVLDEWLMGGVLEAKPRQVTALLWGCAVLLHQPHPLLAGLATRFQTYGVAGENESLSGTCIT